MYHLNDEERIRRMLVLNLYKFDLNNVHKKYGDTYDYIFLDELEKLILEDIKEKCLKFVDKNKLIKIVKDFEKNDQRINNIKRNINKSKQEIAKLNHQIAEIYNDKLEKIISKEQYQNISKSKYETLQYEKKKLLRYIANLKEINNNKIKTDYNKIIEDFLNLNNKLIILNLIDIILLYNNIQIFDY